MSPSRSLPSRNSTNSSPNNFIFSGAPLAFASWLNATGHQYRRNISPASVSGPTRVNNSFSSFDNIDSLRESLGVMECWSNGVMGFQDTHDSTTPILHHSGSPLLLQQFRQLFFELQPAVFVLQVKRDR